MIYTTFTLNLCACNFYNCFDFILRSHYWLNHYSASLKTIWNADFDNYCIFKKVYRPPTCNNRYAYAIAISYHEGCIKFKPQGCPINKQVTQKKLNSKHTSFT